MQFSKLILKDIDKILTILIQIMFPVMYLLLLVYINLISAANGLGDNFLQK